MFRVEELVPQDRSQWLNHGWGLTRVKSDPEPVVTHFAEVSSSRDYAIIRRYTGPEEYEELATELAGIELYCHWPVGGAINIPMQGTTVAGVLERRTQKQYRRTCCPNLYTLEFPKMWAAVKKFGPELSELTPAWARVMWAAFRPHYPHVNVALGMLREGTTASVALSPSLILSGTGNRILIFDKMKHVGNITDGKVFVTYEDSIVSRRIQKLLTMKMEGTL